MGRSIRWRLLASYILLTVLILALLSVTFFHLYRETLQDSQRQLMYRDAMYLARSGLEYADTPVDRMQSESYLLIARRYDGIIWLVDMQGEGAQLDGLNASLRELSLSRDDMQTIQTYLQTEKRASATLDLQKHFADEMLSEAVYLRDTDSNEITGIIVIHMRTSMLNERMRAVHKNVINAGFVAILCSVVLMFCYARGIIRPLKQISNACRSVRKGDFSARVETNRSDEIGQMAQSFNAMITRLDGIEQSRQKFIADVSHELRTPLTNMQGYLQGISDGVIPESQRDKYLGVVQSEVKHMSGLVQDLLQMSQFTAGQITLQCCKMDLCDLICRVLIRFETAIREKDLQVETAFAQDVHLIYADPMRMEQVFGNLMDNAIKFTPRGGRILVGIESAAGGALTAYVKDSGVGMCEQECAYVFDRFYKTDSARTHGGGYGLGLSIAQQIVLLHHAQIHAQSQKGVGTTFVVTFPSDMVM